MKPILIRLFCVSMIVTGNLYGQHILPNICDSTALTALAYQKCRIDSAWTEDIIVKTNYIAALKTQLLPKYRVTRKELFLPLSLTNALKTLRAVYDTVLFRKLAIWEAEMDRNQEYVQPKAYISSVLSFQLFKLYPDIYAVLLNDIHLQLNPKTTKTESESYTVLFNQVLHALPTELHDKLLKITSDFSAETKKLHNSLFIRLLQGSIDDRYRSQCEIVNFLLWEK